jgi:pimeloyl-ACP methyl ester carboxylesterase
MHLAVRHPGRMLGLVIVDPVGAVPDGGLSDIEQNLTQRIRPELAARARALDERAMAGQGTAEASWTAWPSYDRGTEVNETGTEPGRRTGTCRAGRQPGVPGERRG